MGVRTLIGVADGTSHAAAMYDSVTGWMIGPVWEAEDAEDQIDAFLDWLRSADFAELVSTLGLATVPRKPEDARSWSDADLSRLISRWRSENVGDDGWLLDDRACACGHQHGMNDADGDAGCNDGSCSCVEWKPGNPRAALRAADPDRDVLVP